MRSPLQVHRQSGDDEMGRQSTSPNTFYSTDANACSLGKQEMMHNAVNATVVSLPLDFSPARDFFMPGWQIL